MKTDYCVTIEARMKYIRDLDPAEARFHTFHLWGSTYFDYLHNSQREFRENQWRSLIRDIPPKYIIEEAKPSYGYVIDGRLFNIETLRFQQLIKELWRTDVLANLEKLDSPRIVEIGGGHGQLSYHLKRLLPTARFVLIDLPMVNTLAEKYLSYHLREKMSDFAFYDDENYRKARFDRPFDLVISANALHECAASQVQEYAEFIRDHLAPTGVFYYSGGDDLSVDPSGMSVSKILAPYFEYQEISIEGGNTAKGNYLTRLLDISPRKILERIRPTANPAFASHHRLYRLR